MKPKGSNWLTVTSLVKLMDSRLLMAISSVIHWLTAIMTVTQKPKGSMRHLAISLVTLKHSATMKHSVTMMVKPMHLELRYQKSA